MENNKRNNAKVVIVGLGNAGLRILDSLQKLPEARWLDMIAIDTDKKSLEACGVETKIAAGFDWTSGLGCGGDIHKGERTLSLVRNELGERIQGADLLVLTGGLGGGTSTGGAPIVASVARNAKIATLFIMTTPFGFEGHGRRKNADNGMKTLNLSVDALLPVPNDLLYSVLPADTPAEEAFMKANEEMGRVVLGICEVMRCQNMIAPDVADFKEVLNAKKNTCAIGVGVVDSKDGLNRGHLAVERLLESPLLGGIPQIKSAHALVVSLTGGSDLSIGEIKKTLESVQALAPPSAKLIIGANTDPAYDDRVQLTAIAIRFDEKDVEAPVTPSVFETEKPATRQKKTEDDLVQAEFLFKNVSRGIFSNTPPTYVGDSEDLDLPAFQRHDISIDPGETTTAKS